MNSTDPDADQDWNFDPSEPRYCICNQVSYGEMVACDNQDVSVGNLKNFWLFCLICLVFMWLVKIKLDLSLSFSLYLLSSLFCLFRLPSCVKDSKSKNELVITISKLNLFQCLLEWFHYPCVGITSSPKGKWYCPHCTATMTRRKGRK